jgi:hypothetical protein
MCASSCGGCRDATYAESASSSVIVAAPSPGSALAYGVAMRLSAARYSLRTRGECAMSGSWSTLRPSIKGSGNLNGWFCAFKRGNAESTRLRSWMHVSCGVVERRRRRWKEAGGRAGAVSRGRGSDENPAKGTPRRKIDRHTARTGMTSQKAKWNSQRNSGKSCKRTSRTRSVPL